MKQAAHEREEACQTPVDLDKFPHPFSDARYVSARHKYFVSRGQSLRSQEQSVRWMNFHQRRSEIFAETRYLLAKKGPERFNVRRLDERCELTTQSIYNLVGRRTEIMIAAVSDHTNAVLDFVMHSDQSQRHILAIDEVYLELSIKYPEFIANATKAMLGDEAEMRRELFKAGCKIRQKWLACMQKEGRILPDVDCAFIAEQLTVNGCASAQEWVLSFFDAEDYKRKFRWRAAAVLYHFIPKSERANIEPLLDAHGATSKADMAPIKLFN